MLDVLMVCLFEGLGILRFDIKLYLNYCLDVNSNVLKIVDYCCFFDV